MTAVTHGPGPAYYSLAVPGYSNVELALESVVRGSPDPEGERVALGTDRGTIDCRYHPVDSGQAGVVWVFGAGGGLGGPAGGLYLRLAKQLVPAGIASLRVDYRRPGDLVESVLDALLGIAFMVGEGYHRVVLVGHSFGGAVVISAGAMSEEVIGVAALSSQSYGTRQVSALAPRPLLLVHGTADEVLGPVNSENIFARAREPKRLVLYRGCRHGLDQCREALDGELDAWIREVAAGGRPA